MENTNKSAIAILDGVPHFELAADMAFYPLMEKGDGVIITLYFGMASPQPAEIKSLLSALTLRFKVDGQNTVTDPPDWAVAKPIFDHTFRRLIGIELPDGSQPSDKETQQWLDENDHFKIRAVRESFGGHRIVMPPEGEEGPKRFIIGVTGARSARIKMLLYDPTTQAECIIEMKHKMAKASSAEHMRFEKAVGRTEMGVRNDFRSISDFDMLTQLYDNGIIEVSGVCLNGEPCTNANKAQWLRLIPVWHKVAVVEDVYRTVSAKNF